MIFQLSDFQSRKSLLNYPVYGFIVIVIITVTKDKTKFKLFHFGKGGNGKEVENKDIVSLESSFDVRIIVANQILNR